LPDEFGKTPLHYASENQFFFMINFLLEKNANPNAIDKELFSVFGRFIENRKSFA